MQQPGTGADMDRSSFEMEELRSFRMDDGVVYAVVGHNLDLRIMSDVWLGDFRSEEHFRDVVTYMMSLLETGKYDYWLADSRFIANQVAPAEDWVFAEVFPKAISMGLKKFAIVGPKVNAIGMDATEAIEHAKELFQKHASNQIRAFVDIHLAKQWLLSGQ